MKPAVPAPPASNLGDIRAGIGLTQLELAVRLGMAQSQISRIEHQEDALISTLARYVDGLGGRLEIRIRFETELVGLIIPSLRVPRHLGLNARRRRAKRVTSRDPIGPSGTVGPPPWSHPH